MEREQGEGVPREQPCQTTSSRARLGITEVRRGPEYPLAGARAIANRFSHLCDREFRLEVPDALSA